MKLELWSNRDDEYGYIVDEGCIKRRVFLENHTVIYGLDESEINTLFGLYLNELLKENQLFDMKEFLINISRGWFCIIQCVNKYVELSDCILFNHINNNFETLIDNYSDSSERYIEICDDEGYPITLGEFEFSFRRILNIREKCKIKEDAIKGEYLYKRENCDYFLYKKSNLDLNCKKGIIISKSAIESLKNTGFVITYIYENDILKVTNSEKNNYK